MTDNISLFRSLSTATYLVAYIVDLTSVLYEISMTLWLHISLDLLKFTYE